MTDQKTNELWEWTKAIGVALIIALSIRSFIFAPIVVDGESMIPTLQDRERLIINKIIYHLQEPKRGDIIVFHSPEDNDWIKRVIALPGDEVEARDGQVYVNGEALEEDYLQNVLTRDFEKVSVPDDMIFVMGDNRYNSRDSSNPHVGPIPIKSVFGKAQFVFWPTSNIRVVR